MRSGEVTVKRTLPADTFCNGCTLIAMRPATGAAAAVCAFGASSNRPDSVIVELMRRLATCTVLSPMSFCELRLALPVFSAIVRMTKMATRRQILSTVRRRPAL